MKKIFTYVFLFLIILLSAGCKKSRHGLTLVDGVLTVGVEIGYPPMEYYDTNGTLAGFDIELTKALAEKLGLEVKYIDTAWEGIFAGLDTGRYDIAVNVTILPQRQENYNFTRPYIDSSITYVTLKNSSVKIKEPQDIAGLRVSYQGDTTAQYFSEKLIRQGVMFSFFSYDKIINCFDDLRVVRVDLVIVDNIVAFDYAAKPDSLFEVIWQGPSDEYIGICLKKGNDSLTGALNDALDELFADGALRNISFRIFGKDLIGKRVSSAGT